MQAKQLKIPKGEEFEMVKKRIDELLVRVIDDIINIINGQLDNVEEVKRKYDEYYYNFKKEKKRINEKTNFKLQSKLT
jgi:hypothetical protein